ncbi:MAG: prefoldin subunit beta [Candidatus Aenigmatarchaeota archaeon]
MSELKITPETQQILMELQAYQQQMQTVLIQKESLSIQNMEMDKALVELGKVKDEDVFKAVGPILIKADKEKLKIELNERKETIDLRLKSLNKQEKRMKDRMEENQKKLEEILKGHEKKSAAE